MRILGDAGVKGLHEGRLDAVDGIAQCFFSFDAEMGLPGEVGLSAGFGLFYGVDVAVLVFLEAFELFEGSGLGQGG